MRIVIEGERIAIGVLLAVAAAAVAAWVTHVAWILTMLASNTATIRKALLAAFGFFCPPVGALHGVMIWFGAGLS